MAFTYDVTTDRGKVRLRIADTNTSDADQQIFTDAEIDAFLEMEGTVRLAAAMALETIAANQVQVLKVIRILDLQTDGAAVARELRMQAQALREQDAASAEDLDGLFDWAEMAVDDFSARERIEHELLRASA